MPRVDSWRPTEASTTRLRARHLTERVRQEENGWPDQPGGPSGKRGAHGTGNSHLCLLESKRQVEDAIYGVGAPEHAPGSGRSSSVGGRSYNPRD